MACKFRNSRWYRYALCLVKRYLKEIVEDVVFSQYELGSGSHLVEDYARAFISEVNFYEIAQRINEELELQTEYDN